MQMVKIQIPDRDARIKALAELVRRGRIECLRDNVFIVPEPAIDVLAGLGIGFQELGRGGFDYVQKALRDSAAAEVQ